MVIPGVKVHLGVGKKQVEALNLVPMESIHYGRQSIRVPVVDSGGQQLILSKECCKTS